MSSEKTSAENPAVENTSAGKLSQAQFNAEQWAAITSTARNLLVLAGAGTGKTRTIIGRAAYLIEQGVAPEKIAIITFTRRSSAEIKERLVTTCGAKASNVVTGTFHNFCMREMRSRRSWFGFDNVTVMDRDDQMQLMKLVRGKVSKKQEVPQASQLITYYSYARNTNQPLRDYLRKFTDLEGLTIDHIEKLCDDYKQRKRQASYFDYDDILHRFAKVMRENDEVRQRVSAKFEHVLVDEMQDTNPLQWLILQSLADHAHLFCVGDDAQSIYAFRGADFQNVHSFDQRVDSAETMKLELNYRSTQEILDLANWLLDKSSLEYDKHLQAHRGSGVTPSLTEFFSDYEEAEWVVNSILDRHRNGQLYQDQMVLVRSAYAARAVEGQLIERKIPYRFVGGIGLLQMAHVKDLLSCVRVAVNLRDEIGWMRFLTLWPKIGEVTATRLTDAIWDTSDMSQAVEAILAKLPKRDDVVGPLKMATKHLKKPVKALAEVAKLIAPIMEQKYERWESRAKDFKLLEKLAGRHETLESFLETYTLDPISSTEAAPEEDEDILTLITVHSAKGTEAKTCYVIAAQPGNYPHIRSINNPDEIEEERRVLYVALTRAMDELVISRHMSVGGGRASWNDPTGSHYFLDDLPSKLVTSQIVMEERGPFFDPSSYDDDDVIR